MKWEKGETRVRMKDECTATGGGVWKLERRRESEKYTLFLNMSSLQVVNSKAENVKKLSALVINCNAAEGLQEVLRTNLGPKGTYKM